jgi:hypothetical protein
MNLESYRSSASFAEMRSPTYSIMRSPLRIRRVAKPPSPATGEERTSNGCTGGTGFLIATWRTSKTAIQCDLPHMAQTELSR